MPTSFFDNDHPCKNLVPFEWKGIAYKILTTCSNTIHSKLGILSTDARAGAFWLMSLWLHFIVFIQLAQHLDSKKDAVFEERKGCVISNRCHVGCHFLLRWFNTIFSRQLFSLREQFLNSIWIEFSCFSLISSMKRSTSAISMSLRFHSF